MSGYIGIGLMYLSSGWYYYSVWFKRKYGTQLPMSNKWLTFFVSFIGVYMSIDFLTYAPFPWNIKFVIWTVGFGLMGFSLLNL